jgi:hypothetical protein
MKRSSYPNIRIKFLIGVFAVGTAGPGIASGDVISNFDFTGSPPWEVAKEPDFATFAARAPSSDTDLNSTTSILSNSGYTGGTYASFYIRDIDGFSIFSSSATQGVGMNVGAANATVPTNYIAFTVTPDSGYQITFESLSFYTGTNATNDTYNIELRAWNGVSEYALGSASHTPGVTNEPVVFKSIDFADFTNSATTEFRLYGYNIASSGGGIRYDDILLNGITTAIGGPPPSIVQTILIDAGITTQSTVGNWNNFGAPATGNPPADIADLIDDTGASTGISLTYANATGTTINSISGAAANYSGPYPAGLFGIPQSALQDGLFRDVDTSFDLVFANLDTNLVYNFTLYGARGNFGGQTTYTATGANSAEGVISTVFNNSTEFVTLTNIQPTAEGEIVLKVAGTQPNGSFSTDDGSLNFIGITSAVPTGDLQLRIAANPSNPGNYDFDWDSQSGKIYDLVSSTDLTTAPATWSVWDGRSDIASGGTVTSLANVPGGGDLRRFFVVVEKNPPAP